MNHRWGEAIPTALMKPFHLLSKGDKGDKGDKGANQMRGGGRDNFFL